MALLLFFREVRAMRTQKQFQTKITDFISIERQSAIIAEALPPQKTTMELILERLERIEAKLDSGQVIASVSISRPAVGGGPPVRSSELVSKPTEQAKELRELMNIPDDQEFVSTSKEILAAIRRQKN